MSKLVGTSYSGIALSANDIHTAINISVDDISFHEWTLDRIPKDVIKEYYLRKCTKLGKHLQGEEE